jgi:hypothetical protein
MEEEMSDPTGDGKFLSELEIEVKAELSLAESSGPDEVVGEASAEWLYESIDVHREEILLRSLLGAVEAIEGDDPRNDLEIKATPLAAAPRPETGPPPDELGDRADLRHTLVKERSAHTSDELPGEHLAPTAAAIAGRSEPPSVSGGAGRRVS